MRNLIWFGLMAVFSACSAQGQMVPSVMVEPHVFETKSPVNTVTPLTTNSTALIVSARTPAATLRATPSRIPLVEPTATTPSVTTRTATAASAGPICNRMADVETVGTGELGSATNPIVIGLVMYGDMQRTTDAGAQLVTCLGEINGLTYTALVGANARETVDALASGEAQVAFLDVISILYGQQEYGFDTGLVILRTEQDQLQSFSRREFFANKAAVIKHPADLKGRTFCFGEPGNLLNTILPRIILSANRVDPDTDLESSRYKGFADTIAVAVYKGECDAGSGYTDILTFPGEALKKYPDLAGQVETFYVSDPIPNDGVQYARGLDAKIQEATTIALLTMAADNPGKHPPLVTLYKIEGFMRAGNKFYGEFGELVKRAGVDLSEIVR